MVNFVKFLKPESCDQKLLPDRSIWWKMVKLENSNEMRHFGIPKIEFWQTSDNEGFELQNIFLKIDKSQQFSQLFSKLLITIQITLTNSGYFTDNVNLL